MIQYIFRRILLMIPTLIGITLVCFVVINLAPGSPIEQKLREIQFGGGGSSMGSSGGTGGSERSGAVSQEVIDALKKQYGFDKPMHIRYLIWMKNIVTLDFGKSFTYEQPVTEVILSRLPISLQFGITSFIVTYLVCISLGVYKAIKVNSLFDRASTVLVLMGYATPAVMLSVLLIVFFAGDVFLNIFPAGELYSDHYESLSFFGKIGDRIHHFVLPMICYMIGGFASLTQMMKNSMLDVINQDYVRTAKAKGLDDRTVYFKHAFRNALIPIVTGMGGFLGIFLAGSYIIEKIFQLDGIGLLGFNAVMARDYNLLMGLFFIQSILMLLGRLISDLAYVLVDPRIDFK